MYCSNTNNIIFITSGVLSKVVDRKIKICPRKVRSHYYHPRKLFHMGLKMQRTCHDVDR
jgi:hypothetical protein